MKTFKVISLLFLLWVALGSSVLAQGSGCSSGKRVDGIYYTDCYPWVMGDGTLPGGSVHNDTVRLQEAIDDAAGGKLIFNEDVYHITGALNLHSFQVLEGLTTTDTTYTDLRLIQTANNTNVFFIGEGIHDIAIRDMGILYQGVGEGNTAFPTNANAIKAEGDPDNDHSTFFEFAHLRIRGFTKGIYVHSLDAGGWQFDNNQLIDSSIEGCDYGVHLDSLNTGWNMNNVVFASEEDQNGIFIEKAGYVNMNLIVGNGTYIEDVPSAGEFLRIEIHGFINVQNANGEAYKKSLIIEGPDDTKGTPIILMNNDFQECHWDSGTKPSVVIKNATVVSQGNQYLCVGEVARPSVEGWAEIYSTGDKFCLEGSGQCFSSGSPYAESTRSGWAIKSPAALVRTDAIGDLNDITKAFVDLSSTYSDTTPPFKPLFSLTDSFFDGSNYYKWRYAFSRNRLSGRLELNMDINGSGSASATGYYFKGGPVQLQSTTQSSLSSYNTVTGSGDSGSLLYCSDCTAGSTPCAGSGSGALALRVGSAWHCK